VITSPGTNISRWPSHCPHPPPRSRLVLDDQRQRPPGMDTTSGPCGGLPLAGSRHAAGTPFAIGRMVRSRAAVWRCVLLGEVPGDQRGQGISSDLGPGVGTMLGPTRTDLLTVGAVHLRPRKTPKIPSSGGSTSRNLAVLVRSRPCVLGSAWGRREVPGPGWAPCLGWAQGCVQLQALPTMERHVGFAKSP